MSRKNFFQVCICHRNHPHYQNNKAVPPACHFTRNSTMEAGCNPLDLPTEVDERDDLLPYQVQKLPPAITSPRSRSRNARYSSAMINSPPTQFRALYMVPYYLVDRLVEHPILCRGSMFFLEPTHVESKDDDIGTILSNCLAVSSIVPTTSTTLLSATFLSPYPHEVALCIAERLTQRVLRTAEEYQEDQAYLKRNKSHASPKGKARAKNHASASGGSSSLSQMIFGRM